MSVFKEMHKKNGFDSEREYQELLRMLSEAISRGFVEEVPVMIVRKVPSVENWYRDVETGEIFSLSPLNPPARGAWHPVEMQELKGEQEAIH